MFGQGNPEITVISPLTYNNGAWVNATGTRNRTTGTLTLYVNGAQVATTTNTGATNTLTATTTVSIMRRVSALSGNLAIVQAYTSALTAAEVQSNYNIIAPRFIVPPTPTPTITSTKTPTPTITQ
jgi:hypothetical protein